MNRLVTGNDCGILDQCQPVESEDHPMITDPGPADGIRLKVKTVGKAFEPIERKPVIV